MIRVFADSSFFVATINHRDQHSRAARRAISDLREPRVHTCEETLGEVLTFFSASSKGRRNACTAIRAILASPNFVVHTQSSDSFRAALAFYEARQDKGYSFVDCRSMLLMQQLGISLALTNDHHFAQEGFTLLF